MSRHLLTSFLLLSCCLFSGSSLAGVVAYYPFDSDFTDASGNGNHLSIAVGAPTITTTIGEHAFGGGALDLNSSTSNAAYLSLTTAINFTSSDAWSISFWIRRRPGSDDRQGMVIGNPGNTTDFIWASNNATQVQGVRFRSSDNQNAEFGGFPDDGAFHHWVIISNGAGTISAYRDKVKQSDSSVSGNFSITSIGHAYNSVIQSMNGQIDELYIYNEAIDAATVETLYNSGIISGEPDETPPTLASSDIIDNANGGPVAVGTELSYTVSFSEAMNAATVDSADFGNAGTAPVTIGSISETAPGVFIVPVTPTDTGTLQISLLQGASLSDAAGNLLDTTSPISDDTIFTVESAVTPPTITNIHVFLLGGQSNADGRADPSGLPTSPVNLQQAQTDVSLYEAGNLIDLVPVGSEFGPEITMGRRLADSLGSDSGTRVAIIKYAVGGTSLHVDWAPGGDGSTTGDGPRYVTFQNTVTNGLTALAAAYPDASITIKGMLWVQGERDVNSGYENLYETNLTNFIADVRATYGTDLPFIISRLSINQTALASAPLGVVRTAQTKVANDDAFSRLIDTDSFGMKSDNLHFDAFGQQDIGKDGAGWLLDFYPFPSPPMIEARTTAEFGITVSNAFAGFVYTLESSGTMAPGSWEVVESKTAAGTTVEFTVTVASSADRQFYRVWRTLID